MACAATHTVTTKKMEVVHCIIISKMVKEVHVCYLNFFAEIGVVRSPTLT